MVLAQALPVQSIYQGLFFVSCIVAIARRCWKAGGVWTPIRRWPGAA
jgi:hypothetical protein